MELASTILFGKTRRAVLTNLFLEAERGFRLRELARLTGISSGAIQHELQRLLLADLVRRSEEHGQILYRANQNSQIFEELKSIVEKTSGIGRAIREVLWPMMGEIEIAFIYGSIAKGQNTARSDVDLLVVGPIKHDRLLSVLYPVEQKLKREISVRLFSPQEYRRRMVNKDRFLMDVLEGSKMPLVWTFRPFAP